MTLRWQKLQRRKKPRRRTLQVRDMRHTIKQRWLKEWREGKRQSFQRPRGT